MSLKLASVRWGWLVAFASAGLVLAPLSAQEKSASEASPTPMEKLEKRDNPAKPADKDTIDYELIKLFTDSLDQVERNYVKEIDRRELLEAAIKGMMSKLDPYSQYIPPNELEKFRSSVENEFGGIGITVSVESGELTVLTPIFGTPAFNAGIRGGDVILEIEGRQADEREDRHDGKDQGASRRR
jgi:carboxyl-terminal processing protease